MYKLKQALRRGSALVGAVGLLAGIGSSALPALASADALNPLTERSLTLSSSSPGWAFTDGSGNSTYAGPNTGTNGQKTGNTFSFRTSSAKTIKAFTFQYCTRPAGQCAAPGDNTTGTSGTNTISTTAGSSAVTGTGTTFKTTLNVGARITTAGGNTYTVASIADDTDLTLTSSVTTAETGVTFTYRDADTASTSDLNIVVDGTTNAEVSGSDWMSLTSTTDSSTVGTPPPLSATGDTGANAVDYANPKQVPDGQDTVSPYDHSAFGGANNSNGVAGNFIVFYGSSATGYANEYSGSWNMSVSNQEETTVTTDKTGQNNLITLTNSGSGIALNPGDYVKIIFFGTDKNYITNPGSGAFFVKINDFDQTTNINPVTDASQVIDGGVTVANVMNESIAIQTKVLETMDFSVGTVDPDTLSAGTTSELATATSGARTAHGACDPILPNLSNTTPHNVLTMGDPTAENSLQTDKTFATHSYWRLSSNSSGGATVYYAGNTLSNTEGDEIAPIGTTAAAPLTANEQFGLALDNSTSSNNYGVDYAWAANGAEAGADAGIASGGGLDSGWTTYESTHTPAVHNPQLFPLVPTTAYGGGTGGINTGDSGGIASSYAFDANSQTIPTAIATESSRVVDCVTGKMRYIANIAATTPAGIYTTKINYIAAPQY